MPVTTLAILVVLAALALEAAVARRDRRSGWLWFFAWCVAGFLSAFATLSFAIGLLLLPFALLAVVVAGHFAAAAETLGLLPGIGLMCFVVAAVGADDEGGTALWWAAGAGLVSVGLLLYVLLRPRARQAPRTLPLGR